MTPHLYRFDGVCKEYQGPGEILTVLDNVSLAIGHGESIAVVGASGAGKSTFLHLLGTLDTPTRGTVYFEDRDVTAMSPDEKADLRNKSIGFVFQFHHLLPEFSTLENVAMQAVIGGMGREAAFALAADALKSVGLQGKEKQSVTTLSGGERQRAAIARAILAKPRVLLADEPTGNLDEKTGAGVAELLLTLNRDLGMAMVVVTHNRDIAGLMERRLELRSGDLYDQMG
ncbi:outer membrane-specific lipoprotein transporter subunit; ATP-binding component of ABC superfamily [uncultured delta proteobacterium]|uniref:Outer membrane-specific lipoprotein transporter subunit ATP-binding component of ABC superfamily n=1 Tax=uncultured delta proteobacterium TaxID=34034 RepID=A0A212JW14_9DELT|nr:outer membrane-specific lipoprotein transporter subunit; ATP-binding component of ABC superfamily [uncultured delta proteobacterium]